MKIGVQLHPQATTVSQLRDAWKAADAMGVDSLWLWDHFYPLYGDPDAAHFECYTLLSVMASDTCHASVGTLVTCYSYRNPNLLADMARTIDHISNGRFVLALGSGWFERDYQEYGYEFGTAIGRLRTLEANLPVITDRLGKLNPPPVQPRIPIMIGGSGEKVTLRLVAQYADQLNTFGPVDNFRRKNEVLNAHCAAIGRDPREIERTVAVEAKDLVNTEQYAEAGADHLIVMLGAPFNLAPIERWLGEHR